AVYLCACRRRRVRSLPMSIRRPKRASRKNDPDVPSGAGGSQSAKMPEWATAVGDQPDDEFAAYAPGSTFAYSALVRHAKFGKGIVVAVDGNKIDILFEQGIRKLVHATPG